MLGVQHHAPPTTRSASHHAATKNLPRGKSRRSNVIESPPDSTNTTPSPSAERADLPHSSNPDSEARESAGMGGKEKKTGRRKRIIDSGSENEGDASKADEEQTDANYEEQDNDTHRGSSPLSELSPAPSNDDEDDVAGNEAAKENDRADRGAAEAAPDKPSAINGIGSSTGAPAKASSSTSPPNIATSNHVTHPQYPFPTSASAHEYALAGPSAFPNMHTPLRRHNEEKFSVLLDLNNELLKICYTFASQGRSIDSIPEALPYYKKLSILLTWLSAMCENRRMDFPNFDFDFPPPPTHTNIVFPGGVFERLAALSARIPSLFAKDISRRQRRMSQMGSMTPTTPSHAPMSNMGRQSVTPSASVLPSSVGIKRDRESDLSIDSSRGTSPSAAKRQNTGERAAGTPAPMSASFAPPGPWGSSSDMMPPSTPGFPHSASHPHTPISNHQMQSHMSGAGQGQMTRPGSSMGGMEMGMAMGMGGMQTPVTTGMGADSIMPPGTPSISPGAAMGLGANMNMGMNINLSPEAQARARQQMQMRQQAILQQQQQQQQHAHAMQSQQMQSSGQQSSNPSMSPPQPQLTPSNQQQQMMQNSGQISPPGSSGGPSMQSSGSMGMGMNGTGMDPSSMNQMPGANMGAQNGMNMGMGVNMGQGMAVAGGMNNMGMPSYISLNPQQMQMLMANSMQIVQNPSHQLMQSLAHSVPNWNTMPIQEKLKRVQAVMANQTQRRMNQQNLAPNTPVAGVNPGQLQQASMQGGQMGMPGQGMDNVQMPGTSMAARTATGMAGSNQMGNVPNLSQLNPQQRQLVLMQMQMRNASNGMTGPGQGGMPGMNPQIALQERQRLELQQQQARMLAQRQSSPLNPNSTSGMATPDQFSPGMQRSTSNSSIGISQTARAPAMGDASGMSVPGTPRMGGMMPGTQEYQRQMIAAQRQQLMQQQQLQQQSQNTGAWAGQQQQQQQQIPMSAGTWSQQNQQFGMSGNMASPANNLMNIPDRSSATPAPTMGQQSPTVSQTNDFSDMVKW